MFHRVGCCGSHWPHGPRRPLLSSRPEDAANHQERRAWDIWNLAIYPAAAGGRDRRAGGARPRRCALPGDRGDVGGTRRAGGRAGRYHHGGRAGCRPRGGGRRDRLRDPLGAVPRSSGAPLRRVHYLAAARRPGPGGWPGRSRWRRAGGAAPSSASCRCPTGGSTATRPRPRNPARIRRRRAGRAGQALRHLARADPASCWRSPGRRTCSAMMWPSWPRRCRPSTAAGSRCWATPPIP
jgi:hypothetical protein